MHHLKIVTTKASRDHWNNLTCHINWFVYFWNINLFVRLFSDAIFSLVSLLNIVNWQQTLCVSCLKVYGYSISDIHTLAHALKSSNISLFFETTDDYFHSPLSLFSVRHIKRTSYLFFFLQRRFVCVRVCVHKNS